MQPPRWFKVAAVVALLWNLMGCAAYLADVMLTDDDVAKMNDSQRTLYESRPAWSVAGTAIAVWGGALGSLALLLRRRWALPVLVLSLLGVIVQDIALFILGDAVSLGGPAVVGMQTLVLLVSIALVLLARRGVREGWLV